MSFTLRILLIVVSVIAFVLVVKKVKTSKIKTEDAVIWIIGSLVLIFMCVFLSFMTRLSYRLGFVSPANFVFLVVCFFLLLTTFNQSIKISNLSEKIKELNHYIALKEEKDEVGRKENGK